MSGIGKSQEDYLEAILVLEKSGRGVRSVDVAEHLGFSKPSVSRAMGQLIDAGLVQMEEGKQICLTEAGRRLAQQVYEKHQFFTQMLKEAGVDDAQAAEDACLIEHAISDESFSAIKAAFQRNQQED